MCSYLYQRAFLKQHYFRFEPGLIHEDELWTSQVLLTAQRIDKAREMIHICEELQHQGTIGYRCKETILNRMKLYFYEIQADIYHKINQKQLS